MGNIHVVGGENSFTWLASRSRFGKKHRLINGGDQQILLKKLATKNKKRLTDPAVVPIWNSNSGAIVLDDRTQENLTAGTLKGDAGKIVDLWGKQISFSLGTLGNKLSKKCAIYSVIVAKHQCSDFFITNDMTFCDASTTTIACQDFIAKGQNGDGLLCSVELLRKNKINILKKDVANPFNYTVFFGLNKYPAKNQYTPKISLGCFLMDLQGHNDLPTEFILHWNEIAKSKNIISKKNIIHSMPKIVFILRFEESKVLLLMEMPIKKGLKNPWMPVSGDSSVKLLGQVGLLNKSFSKEISGLSMRFRRLPKKDISIFYERRYEDQNKKICNCFWSCPQLNISVHGFEPDLVKNCARLQVDRLNNLSKEGMNLLPEVKSILNRYDKDIGALKLANDSKPDTFQPRKRKLPPSIKTNH